MILLHVKLLSIFPILVILPALGVLLLVVVLYRYFSRLLTAPAVELLPISKQDSSSGNNASRGKQRSFVKNKKEGQVESNRSSKTIPASPSAIKPVIVEFQSSQSRQPNGKHIPRRQSLQHGLQIVSALNSELTEKNASHDGSSSMTGIEADCLRPPPTHSVSSRSTSSSSSNQRSSLSLNKQHSQAEETESGQREEYEEEEGDEGSSYLDDDDQSSLQLSNISSESSLSCN
jgi:hypothetical protein